MKTSRSRRAPAIVAAALAVAAVGALASGCATLGTASGAAPAGTPLHSPTRSFGCHARGALPDPGCTPGSVLAAGAATICRRGYARSVRNVPRLRKLRVYLAYGVVHHRRGAYEVDHLVPLELGGANDVANLWPQRASPSPGYHDKDALENYLHARVCAGRMQLRAAQGAIARDWVAAWIAAGRP